ncbi:MAG: PEGA domain-containing protein [Pirellulales bacterium]
MGSWLLLAVACASSLGCVQRRMTIRSNPPGALVYVDNYELGTTPVSTDFIYYGTREIRLVKDGYETQTRLVNIPPPWYQYVPIDFVAENLIPYEVRDERQLDFAMQPQRLVPTEELLGRADSLRATNRGENYVIPAGAVQPLPAGVEPIPPGVPDMRLPN